MALTGEQALGAALKKVKGLASGFDHATRTGDNTFTIYFIDGTSVNLTIPKPLDGKDGVGITDVKFNADGHLICTMSDGTEIDAGELDANGALTEDLTATQEIGSVTAGKKYLKGTPLETIIRDMLIKEVAPSVVLTLAPATELYDIVAEEVAEIKLTAKITKGTYDPTTVSFYVDGVKVSESEVDLRVGNTYAFTYTPATPIKKDTIFKVIVTDGKLSGQSSKTIKFVANSYYGTVGDTVSDPDESIIKALANTKLKDIKKLVYGGITMDYGKVVYAYPKTLGDLTSIKDEKNNINYTASFAKTSATVDGIDYNVYTMIKPSKAVDVEIVFS